MFISPLFFMLLLLGTAGMIYLRANQAEMKLLARIEKVRLEHRLAYSAVDRLGLGQILPADWENYCEGDSLSKSRGQFRKVIVSDVLYARRGDLRFFVARVSAAHSPCSSRIISGFEACQSSHPSSERTISNFAVSNVDEDEGDAYARLAARVERVCPLSTPLSTHDSATDSACDPSHGSAAESAT